MIIGSIKERATGESRVALTPDSAKRINKLGHNCIIESEAGLLSGLSNSDYEDVNVGIRNQAKLVWEESDVIIKVRPPEIDEINSMRKGQTLISFFWPAQNEDLLELAKRNQVTILAMDMVPRISRAQKMDALSSMANLTGYRSVIEASANYGKFFTGQVTAAGKIPPSKVLVIGAGVAGLSAIGTSVSLGAVVRAFDVRPEVAEQIQSMGAEFLFLNFEEDGGGSGGYAKTSSPEFREKQLALFREQAPEIDIVITTALIPGVDAPKLWLADMVKAMKSGSVVVDLAAERGGNCDLTVSGEKVVSENGVVIIGYTDFPSRMASQASMLYGTNIFHMLSELTPNKDGQIIHNMEDDVIRGVTVSLMGEITYPPPPPKTPSVPASTRKKTEVLTPEEIQQREAEEYRRSTKIQVTMLIAGALLTIAVGFVTPPSFMQHFIVFVLSCFVGFQVIWNVNHALHTPLMSVTNAISGIIILGAMLQIGSNSSVVLILAAISVLITSINIVGGFLVTRRMLAMFQRS